MEQQIISALQETAQDLLDEINANTTTGYTYQKVAMYVDHPEKSGITIQFIIKAITDEEEFMRDEQIFVE